MQDSFLDLRILESLEANQTRQFVHAMSMMTVSHQLHVFGMVPARTCIQIGAEIYKIDLNTLYFYFKSKIKV